MSQDKNILPEQVNFKFLIKQGVFKFYFISSLIIIVTLAILAAYLIGNQRNVNLLSEKLSAEVEMTHQDKVLLLKLFEIDEQIIFDGNYETALQNYKKIYDQIGDLAKPSILNRIKKIEDLMNDLENDNQININKDLLIAQNKVFIENLKREKSENEEAKNLEIAELKNELFMVKETLEKKEKQLNRKEKVQIITFTGQKGATIHYLGEIEDGKANGGGMGIWTTGSIYRGEWKNNLRHGKGRFEWADGEKYEGEYVNDIREGQGNYYWPSGERYEGNWTNNTRQGYGTLFDKDGNIRYEGEWSKDKPLK